MSKKTQRERTRARRQQQRRKTTLIWGGIGTGVLLAIGVLLWNTLRPDAGDEVPLMTSSEHLSYETLPQYNTDPPTSGPHISESLPAGFYHEADLSALPPRPEGNLVHNLEHGYVIFWYNCKILEMSECEDLKDDIQGVMDGFDGVKLIAFPWETIKEPIVMTSWGRMQRFDTFDADLAKRFIRSNRNRAPEPQAP